MEKTIQPGLEQARPTPKAFISYGWESVEHREWVRDLAVRLRADGVDVTLDKWELQPGDQLPAFMERAVRENDYVLIICTPHYRRRSNERLGGVGYEGDIMTGEALLTRNERKFIPLFRAGNDWCDAAPTWLQGKYYIDVRGNSYPEDRYQDLITTLHGTRPAAPPIGSPQHVNRPPSASPLPVSEGPQSPPEFVPIQILGVVVDEITQPRGDGTQGSALYTVPFQLSRRPSSEWAQVFIEKWNHPSSWTSMHRPRIASVAGDKVYLNGTTVEEVQKYHRDTLKLALEETNTRARRDEHSDCGLSTKEADRSRARAVEARTTCPDGPRCCKGNKVLTFQSAQNRGCPGK